ncbi:MAG: site-specific integrase [Oscillibacter sp.]|nr:site-specific integrase [Oscillibacter sp.]
MANIREKQKDGKIISFSFTVCLARDASGKQVRRFTTWTPPEGLAPTKARKAAERAADAWEQEVKAEYEKEQQAIAEGRAYMLPPEKRHDDFVAFVNETWFPLQVQGNNRKAKTVSFYSSMTKIINEYFKGRTLQRISPIDIQKYLVYLRTKYQGRFGRPLTPKTVHHQYNTLNLIFSFAEEQEMISKNPMRKVEAPKKQKKPVDALTQEQAAQLFKLLPSLPLDFRCILLLLITTGMRRGECMGLQWGDIDEAASTIRIERNVSYTPESGVIISTPKTVNSIRTIPIMGSNMYCAAQVWGGMLCPWAFHHARYASCRSSSSSTGGPNGETSCLATTSTVSRRLYKAFCEKCSLLDCNYSANCFPPEHRNRNPGTVLTMPPS